MRHWLIKSEPDVFSFDDLLAAPKRTTDWTGVRNALAAIYLREQMQVGDQVLYYHSNAEPPGIAGICEVVRAGYPDPLQFDARSEYFDPKSRPEKPRWHCVDVRAVRPLERFLPLPELRAAPALEGMVVLQKGARLSVTPVSAAHFKAVLALARRRGALAGGGRLP